MGRIKDIPVLKYVSAVIAALVQVIEGDAKTETNPLPEKENGTLHESRSSVAAN